MIKLKPNQQTENRSKAITVLPSSPPTPVFPLPILAAEMGVGYSVVKEVDGGGWGEERGFQVGHSLLSLEDTHVRTLTACG